MHTALEAHVAYFLAKLTTASGNRLQAIATTHSDLMIQYSNQSYLVRKEPFAIVKPELKTTCVQKEKRALLNDAAQFGISRWVNPILLHPLDMLVLVEGRYDLHFIGSANQALGLRQTYKVASLAALLGDAAKGGVDKLIDFIKRNSEAIKSRPSNARVVLLLDSDASGKLQALASTFKSTDPFTVFAWRETEVNPSLDKTFRGVERYISNRLIIEASEQCGGVVAKRANGTYTVTPDDMSKLKQKVNALVRGGLNSSDAAYAKPMLTRLQELADSV